MNMAFASLPRGNIRMMATLARRKFLVGSDGKGFPERLSGPKKDYPFKIEARDIDISSKATPLECAIAMR